MNTLSLSEKYRPTTIDDIILNDIIYKKIKAIIDTKQITNIILTGASGLGKTSTIKCIAKHIYSKDNFNDAVLELNASDERGIKTVTDIIINFSKKLVFYNEGYCNNKLIILDEADNLTKKAQSLINLVMEQYKNTKFVFICNNSNKIIETLQSKCIVIKFILPPFKSYYNKIKSICDKENYVYDDDIFKYLFETFNNDFRQILNILELTFITFGSITIKNINLISNL